MSSLHLLLTHYFGVKSHVGIERKKMFSNQYIYIFSGVILGALKEIFRRLECFS